MQKNNQISSKIILYKYAFTLVELIVVITILAILGTIAFISLQGYSSNSRDSVRISDISSLKTSLELYNLEAGKYPIPTSGVDITYSGAVVWNQGTFGKTVYANVSKLDKIPLDPTTDKEYTYSVTSSKYEYQLGGIVEGDIVAMNTPPLTPRYQGGGLVQQTNAGETTATAYITGNYNGLLTKSNSGATCNVLSIPAIITNDTSVTDLQQIVTNNSFVYRGYKNLPSSFKTSKFKYNGGFAFTPNNLIAYTDTGSCTALTSTTSSTARVNLLKGLQDSYSGTVLKNSSEIKNIVELNINTSSPSDDVINYAGNFVNNVLGGNIVVSSSSLPSYSCNVTQPINATLTTGSPTIVNQSWQNSNPTNPCYFVCNSGYLYTGGVCSNMFLNKNSTYSPYQPDGTNQTGRFTFVSGTAGAGGSGVVLDNITGLYWMSDGIASGTSYWSAGMTYCANLNLGGFTDWRLPDVTELTSIIDFSSSTYPYYDTTYFSFGTNWFWSSTTIPVLNTGAYAIYPYGANSSTAGKTGNLYYSFCTR